jgi:hypothetical protein
MKLDVTSLAIGAGIGVAVVTVAVVIFVMQPERIILDTETAMAVIASSNNTHFFMSGLIKEISDDAMIIDQTFGNPRYHDNPAVTIKLDRGAAFVSCRASSVLPGETCKDSVANRIDEEQINVCAHTRMYNGEFYAGKMWADSACGPFGIEENKTG